MRRATRRMLRNFDHIDNRFSFSIFPYSGLIDFFSKSLFIFRANDSVCIRDEAFDWDDPTRDETFRPGWDCLTRDATEKLIKVNLR